MSRPEMTVLQEAVAGHVDAVEPGGDRRGQRAGHSSLDSSQVVIADVELAVGLGRKTRPGGDDVDQAGRGVAAEQCALRPAQHFDAVDRAELGQADAGARAIDAVDKHADRGFEAGVVADGADAADSGDAAAAFRLGRGHQQGRRKLGQLADVRRARILEAFGGDRADRDRNVGQCLVAAVGGDDDVAGRRVLLAAGLVAAAAGLAAGGIGLRGAVGLRLRALLRFLRVSRCRKCQQACRKQPH